MDAADSLFPDLQAALVCEDVRQEVNGMQTLVGVLSALPVPQLPARFMKMCIWSRWTNGIGRFTQKSRIIAPDDESVLGENTVQFELREMDAHATNVHFFAGMTFHAAGTHTVEILLDDELQTRFAIAVFIAQRQV